MHTINVGHSHLSAQISYLQSFTGDVSKVMHCIICRTYDLFYEINAELYNGIFASLFELITDSKKAYCSGKLSEA